ncbi:hypothetical protein MPL3356_70174 [Mesorhizobium plurifarium]|uniref:Uncharacterized protein n=1 Tax=Mesorhizobium plurifarium TaxID=69974 RepID=A0A090EH80_MESPL|nr:hypothetical protein MPL3356_70174 [Mesorhizobium plurifarium]
MGGSYGKGAEPDRSHFPELALPVLADGSAQLRSALGLGLFAVLNAKKPRRSAAFRLLDPR